VFPVLIQYTRRVPLGLLCFFTLNLKTLAASGEDAHAGARNIVTKIDIGINKRRTREGHDQVLGTYKLIDRSSLSIRWLVAAVRPDAGEEDRPGLRCTSGSAASRDLIGDGCARGHYAR
jgi:hypothetical protein